ncbi:3'-5' exonuclease [Paenarthrobacter nicotinovorans]|nr:MULTISPECIES: 3'-5' exonuclease [Micrococcaceae]
MRRIIGQPQKLQGHFVEGYVSTVPSKHRLKDFAFAVLDVETTGLEKSDRVVEIAVVRMSASGDVLSEFSGVVRPIKRSVSDSARYVHGLGDEDLRTAPTLGEIWQYIAPHLVGAIVVAYNAPFDVALLGRDLGALGLVQYPVLDLLYAFRSLLTARTYKLEHLLRNLRGTWPRGLHQAHADARCAAELLLVLMSHPQPLFWHGPLPTGTFSVPPTYSGSARWSEIRPKEIPALAPQVGKNVKIRAPKFVPPSDILVRSAIRRQRFYPGNDDAKTREVIDLLVQHGGVEAKKLTSTTRYFVGNHEDFPCEGLPQGVQWRTVDWMLRWIERELAAIQMRVEEEIQYLREAHKEDYASRRHYAVDWRPAAMTPVQYVADFPMTRWDFS